MMLSDYDKINAVLDYDPTTGILRWRARTTYFNGPVKPGDVAGTLKDGYLSIRTGQRNYRAHRLAWLLMTGAFPPKGHEIDHANGDRSDNRWSNLRLANRSENNMNAGLRSNNKSGTKGVSYRPDTGKWHARIKRDGKVTLLGDYASLDEAIAARKAAEAAHFGEFARRTQESL